MKKTFFLAVLMAGCIQTDLEDPFPPALRLDNSISDITFRVDGSYPLDAIYTDDAGDSVEVAVEWSSSNDQTLSFDGNLAMPHEEGLVLISAEANGLTETTSINILPSREMISISGFVPIKQVGSTATLVANYINPDGATVPATPDWSSSNDAIASVNSSGQVTALMPGTTTISVSFNNVSSSMNLEVITGAVLVDPEIKITSFAAFLTEGDQFQFDADYNENGSVDHTVSVVWNSSDESILSIDAAGLATAIGAGTATISATFNNVNASVEVEVESGGTTERTGTLMGYRGYDISGQFTLSENQDGDIILTVTNYNPDGPGPYFYLTNQSSNVNNGLNLGEARTEGTISINVSDLDATTEIGTYNFLVVWCDPFNVLLGYGEFEDE